VSDTFPCELMQLQRRSNSGNRLKSPERLPKCLSGFDFLHSSGVIFLSTSSEHNVIEHRSHVLQFDFLCISISSRVHAYILRLDCRYSPTHSLVHADVLQFNFFLDYDSIPSLQTVVTHFQCLGSALIARLLPIAFYLPLIVHFILFSIFW
jgi:hypothetical protein